MQILNFTGHVYVPQTNMCKVQLYSFIIFLFLHFYDFMYYLLYYIFGMFLFESMREFILKNI